MGVSSRKTQKKSSKKIIDLQKERLKKIKEKIQNGSYHIESDELSGKLIKSYVKDLEEWLPASDKSKK